MSPNRSDHSPSELAAIRLTDLIAHLLREEEQLDFYLEAEGIVREIMDADCTRLQPELPTWNPGKN